MEEIILDLSYLSAGECVMAGTTAAVALIALIYSWSIIFSNDRQNMKGDLLKSSLAAIVMTVLTFATCLQWVNTGLVILGIILLAPLATAIYLIFKENNKIKY